MDSLTSGRHGSNHYLYLHPSPARQSEHEAFEICAQCGKLALLDRLLTRLHRDGHKVLIFSQVCSWGPSHVASSFSPVVVCAEAERHLVIWNLPVIDKIK